MLATLFYFVHALKRYRLSVAKLDIRWLWESLPYTHLKLTNQSQPECQISLVLRTLVPCTHSHDQFCMNKTNRTWRQRKYPHTNSESSWFSSSNYGVLSCTVWIFYFFPSWCACYMNRQVHNGAWFCICSSRWRAAGWCLKTLGSRSQPL